MTAFFVVLIILGILSFICDIFVIKNPTTYSITVKLLVSLLIIIYAIILMKENIYLS